MVTQAPPKTPVEKMLNAFPDSVLKSNGWYAHRDDPTFDWREDEDGNIVIHSWTGRGVSDILKMGEHPLTEADLRAKPGTYRPRPKDVKLDLFELSHYLLLDWQYLFSLGYHDGYHYVNKQGRTTICVKLGGYCNPDGSTYSKGKVRLNLNGKVRFLWDGHTPGDPIPCGLHRLHEAREKGYLLIGEGESDAATLWWHGFPFLGISGAGAIRSLDVSLLAGIPRVYIIEEPDQAQKTDEEGGGFYGNLHKHLRDGGYTGEIWSIRFKLATGYKDPSALHKSVYRDCKAEDEVVFATVVRARFAEKMFKAMDHAIPEGNDSIRGQEDEPEELPPPPPGDDTAKLQWVRELNAVPATVLSPAQKIVLQTILLHSPMWNLEKEQWWQVDASHLSKLAAMPKRQFLRHLSYITTHLGIVEKRHEHEWHETEDGELKHDRCDLFIRPSRTAWLTYPSTYQLVPGAPERKHGGKPDEVRCQHCDSSNVIELKAYYCRDCKSISYNLPEDTQEEQIIETVESTAQVMPLAENTPKKPTWISGSIPDEGEVNTPIDTKNGHDIYIYNVTKFGLLPPPANTPKKPTWISGSIPDEVRNTSIVPDMELLPPRPHAPPREDSKNIPWDLAAENTPKNPTWVFGSIPDARLSASSGNTPISAEPPAALGRCNTIFEMMYSEPHGEHAGTIVDLSGNIWCAKCVPQCNLMNTGYERGYPPIGKLKAGYDAWFKCARTCGTSYIQDLLVELARPASGKKVGAR